MASVRRADPPIDDGKMIEFLTRGRRRLAAARADALWIAMWSAADAALDLILRPRLKRYATGLVLDAGCGYAPYAAVIRGMGLRHVGTDVTPNARADVVADIVRLPFESQTFGTVLCNEVLEHVQDPARALSEIARSLRPGGHVILSVPFLARVHEAPNDFYRYTRFALEQLVERTGLEILELTECGGIFTFFAHQLSSALVPAAFGIGDIPGRGFAALFGVALTGPAILLDRIPGIAKVYPAGYVLIARKATPG